MSNLIWMGLVQVGINVPISVSSYSLFTSSRPSFAADLSFDGKWKTMIMAKFLKLMETIIWSGLDGQFFWCSLLVSLKLKLEIFELQAKQGFSFTHRWRLWHNNGRIYHSDGQALPTSTWYANKYASYVSFACPYEFLIFYKTFYKIHVWGLNSWPSIWADDSFFFLKDNKLILYLYCSTVVLQC